MNGFSSDNITLIEALRDVTQNLRRLGEDLRSAGLSHGAKHLSRERNEPIPENQLASVIAGTLGTSFRQGIKLAFKDGADFSDVFRILRERLQAQLLELSVINPLQNVLFGGQQPTLPAQNIRGNGVVGDVLGEIVKLFSFSARANGGSVAGSTPYLVGERGAELFVPHSSGRIVPNNQLGGGGVTVNMNIQSPDVGGFRAAQGQIAAQMYDAVRRGQRAR